MLVGGAVDDLFVQELSKLVQVSECLFRPRHAAPNPCTQRWSEQRRLLVASARRPVVPGTAVATNRQRGSPTCWWNVVASPKSSGRSSCPVACTRCAFFRFVLAMPLSSACVSIDDTPMDRLRCRAMILTGRSPYAPF